MPESKETAHERFEFGQIKELLKDELLSHLAVVRKGRLIHLPPHFAVMFGYTVEDMLGQEIMGYIANEDRGDFSASWAALPDDEPEWVRCVGIAAGGRRFSLEILARRTICQGTRVELISFWKAFTLPMPSDKTVKEAEEHFRAAFQHAGVGMALLAPNGSFLHVNDALVDLLGYNQEMFHQLLIKDCLLEQDYETKRVLGRRLLTGDVPECKMELRCKRADGAVMWGLLNATVVRDERDLPLYFIIQIQDISEHKEAEELLRKSDKLSAVGRLAAGVAHEVRNPLTVLKGFAQMLSSVDKQNIHYYQLMMSEVNRIESIIGEFLLLARPQKTRFRQNSLYAILEDVITLMETKAIMNKIGLMPVIPEGLPAIECDANQLKQVFINIIQNAIEAMDNGGTVSIVAGQPGDETVSIRIIDEGCGISQEQLARLGEPFFSSKEKGTGLGLMVCYQIIEKHKGRILIDSQPGQGTTFDIRLPVRQYFHINKTERMELEFSDSNSGDSEGDSAGFQTRPNTF